MRFMANKNIDQGTIFENFKSSMAEPDLWASAQRFLEKITVTLRDGQ